jgi:hypothetical protein
MAMVGKAEKSIIANNNVLMNRYSHYPAGIYQLACY